jgi:hypothetical protein
MTDKNTLNQTSFDFLDKKEPMIDVKDKTKPESTAVTQREFDEKAGNKRELWDFVKTGNLFRLISLENIFTPDFRHCTNEFLGGILDDEKK